MNRPFHYLKRSIIHIKYDFSVFRQYHQFYQTTYNRNTIKSHIKFPESYIAPPLKVFLNISLFLHVLLKTKSTNILPKSH